MVRLVLMCGLAGAGKSTVARDLEGRGWLRLSIDVAAWRGGHREHPLPADVRDRIVAAQRVELASALDAGRDVVVDYAFFSRAMRDEYRAIGARHGAATAVVHLDVPLATLRRRLEQRSSGSPSPDSIEVPPALLDTYAHGFEWPGGDEHDVLVVTDAQAAVEALDAWASRGR